MGERRIHASPNFNWLAAGGGNAPANLAQPTYTIANYLCTWNSPGLHTQQQGGGGGGGECTSSNVRETAPAYIHNCQLFMYVKPYLLQQQGGNAPAKMYVKPAQGGPSTAYCRGGECTSSIWPSAAPITHPPRPSHYPTNRPLHGPHTTPPTAPSTAPSTRPHPAQHPLHNPQHHHPHGTPHHPAQHPLHNPQHPPPRHHTPHPPPRPAQPPRLVSRFPHRIAGLGAPRGRVIPPVRVDACAVTCQRPGVPLEHTTQGPVSFSMRLALASSWPCWMREFFVSSSRVTAAWAFCAPVRISAFIWVYFGASSMIRRNSSSEICPSVSALETWSAMVFSLLSASTLTSSCFLAFTESRRPMNLPATPRSPQPKTAISSPRTTGAATIVDKRPTPPMPIPILAEIRAVSTASTALIPRRYFL